MNSILRASRNIGFEQNVLIRVLDVKTKRIITEHSGHNCATNSMLTGIGHYLIGDGVLNQGSSTLDSYVPKYISLGTMGLMNQYEDDDGLPAGIGYSESAEYIEAKEAAEEAYEAVIEAKKALEELDCGGVCIATARCCRHTYESSTETMVVEEDAETVYGGSNCPYKDLYDAYKDALDNYEIAHQVEIAALAVDEEERFIYYMNTRPGYGSDGYDPNLINGRKWFGLGYPYTSYESDGRYRIGDYVTYKGILYRLNKELPNPSSSRLFDSSYWIRLPYTHQPGNGKTVNLELISPSFPRQLISFRDVVPEIEAELPRTIDVVFSAMISTGALAQFREPGMGHIFITEAGLWSQKPWSDSGDNGLLAGYRIIPPNEENWDMHVSENRQILKENIIKVPINCVVQVIWKIQIGSIDRFGGWAANGN